MYKVQQLKYNGEIKRRNDRKFETVQIVQLWSFEGERSGKLISENKFLGESFLCGGKCLNELEPFHLHLTLPASLKPL